MGKIVEIVEDRKVYVGDLVRYRIIFSISAYESIGTVDEFENRMDDIINTARMMEGSTISLDVVTDKLKHLIGIKFIVEGKMIAEETHVSDYNKKLEHQK